MRRFQVVATPCGAWWAFDVVGLPGSHSNAPAFADVEPVARRLIAALLEIDPASFEVDVLLDLAAAESPVVSAGPSS